ncbi:hypothetical protein FRB94_012795 [Tulasnella sp. JGI-2019a]|nr:hypothetical protein FRB94_012795 [Tulasnella sp. JGI-2019a]
MPSRLSSMFQLGKARSDESHTLPPPVSANGPSGNIKNTGQATLVTKRTTFEEDNLPTSLRVHWSRFKKRLGNGSNPSESVLEFTDNGGGSAGDSVIRGGGGGGPQTGVGAEDGKDGVDDENEQVDQVVVDNSFLLLGASNSSPPSEHGAITPDRGGSHMAGATTDMESSADHDLASTKIVDALTAVPDHIWRGFSAFFFTKFYDVAAEAHYKKETYFQMKPLALTGSMFLIINWVLIMAIQQRSDMPLADKIYFWGIAPLSAFPIPIMIVFDWPRTHPNIYQIWMSFAMWTWGAYTLILIQLCGFYKPSIMVFSCTGKDFTGIFYYLCGFPVICLFSLGQTRIIATFFSLLNVVGLAFVVPERHRWIRNVLNYILFTIFLLWVHYQRECAERRLYTIRDRLKAQYKETQKAQVRESRAADSKKRFSSYIFHEVRVPLNTALLAVQNMEATGVFDEDNNLEFTALEGSLNMMSKVLNDVLDFNRMDSGRFESVAKPYAFHKVIKSMLVPLHLAADARGQHLQIELDPQIDEIARKTLYKANGDSPDVIEKKLSSSDDEESGMVVGDEHRLRQIVTNLTSNACKFTPTGGNISVRTKLIVYGRAPSERDSTLPPPDIEGHTRPPIQQRTSTSCDASSPTRHSSEVTAAQVIEEYNAAVGDDGFMKPNLTEGSLKMLDSLPGSRKRHRLVEDRIVIRIEVEDTGVGIRRKDMVDSRLFSPYVQTDIGRSQGGKGTGLGLALSKHIVKLSGGRLGVKSKRNQGSMFWVELPMGVGDEVLKRSNCDTKERMVAQTFQTLSKPMAEAFKPADSEGITPSTFKSTSSASHPEVVFPHQNPETAQAMRQLMEHSGQIDLLTRMDHRLPEAPSRSSLDGLQHNGSCVAIGTATVSQSPPRGLAMKEGRVGSSLRPQRVSMPPPQFTFTSQDSTSGTISDVTPTPVTLVQVSEVGDGLKLSPPLSRPEIVKAGSSASSMPPPTVASPNGPFQPPLNVLVVDDDPLTRKLMSRMLTRNGCNVETAENGKMALDLATSARNPFEFTTPPTDAKPRKVQTPYAREDATRYDLIFLDNQMPIMSGVDMVRKLRSLGRSDYYVVGVTGNALKEDQEEYMDAGADAVLTKPVKEQNLKNCLVAADERRKDYVDRQ